MTPAISRSAHHPATNASFYMNNGGDFQQWLHPSKERKMHFLNHGRAPCYGAFC